MYRSFVTYRHSRILSIWNGGNLMRQNMVKEHSLQLPWNKQTSLLNVFTRLHYECYLKDPLMYLHNYVSCFNRTLLHSIKFHLFHRLFILFWVFLGWKIQAEGHPRSQKWEQIEKQFKGSMMFWKLLKRKEAPHFRLAVFYKKNDGSM